MQVILQGSLRHFPAADLLAFLCRPSRKGTLDLETSGRRTRILFEDEMILSAQSKTAGEGIDAVLDVMEWQEGTFTLLDAAVLPEGTKALALTLAAVQAEAGRRADEKSSQYSDATRFHVVENPEMLQQVSLEAEDFKLLFRLAPGRTVGELLAELTIPRKDLGQRLKHLHGLGLIATSSQEPRAEPKPEPKPEANPRGQDMATVPERVRIPDVPAVPEAEQTIMQAPAADPSVTQPGTPPPPRPPAVVGSLTSDSMPDDVFPLLDAECVIGRRATKEVAFSINDGSVSSKHAKLTRTEEAFVIEDLQSRNGTFVNGEKVTGKRVLVDGDLIRLGKVIMTFNVARQDKASETTVPEIRVE